MGKCVATGSGGIAAARAVLDAPGRLGEPGQGFPMRRIDLLGKRVIPALAKT